MANKGGSFERWFSEELSKWWSQDPDKTDTFWRSQTSGARATTRAKKGKKTFHQYGDIAAVDPIGLPLMQWTIWELKRGYSKHSIADLLDDPGKTEQTYAKWINKSIKNAKQAGSYTWILVVRRDRKIPIVLMDGYGMKVMYGDSVGRPFLEIKTKERTIYGLPLSQFFSIFKPDDIKEFVGGLPIKPLPSKDKRILPDAAGTRNH